MNILIISTCENKFHELEFVRPVVDIIKEKHKYEVMRYDEINNEVLENFDKVIICGTALKDFEYENHLDKFEWIKEFEKPILGICSGSQIICQVFGKLLKSKIEIGLINNVEQIEDDMILEDIELKEVYALHNKYTNCPNGFDIIAKNEIPQIMKKDKIYAILFHPEIRNKKIIENFANYEK